MEQVAVKSNQLPHPAAPYSQAICAGDFVFVAGQTGVDYKTGVLPEQFEAQARQAFENVATVLRAAGSDMRRVVKTTVWLCDAANFDTMNKLYVEYFPTNAPARSTPIVGLPKASFQISIEAIALKGTG